jgi:hypothetical protein
MLPLCSGENRSELLLRVEFANGETLEKLIISAGLIKVKLALEIASQAAGLEAILAEARSSGHQTKQYHGSLDSCNGQNHRP